MIEMHGNLFEIPCDALCITTNGFTKSNGECVMGKGCAKQLATYYPEVPLKLGNLIRTNGNIVQIIDNYGVPVIAFPVKPISLIKRSNNDVVAHMTHKIPIGSSVPGWACKAQESIIIESAKQLITLANKHKWKRVLLPRAGCGAGELS